MRIIILEDNFDRRQAMSDVLADLLPNIETEYFLTSHQMIERLAQTGILDVAIISLDNDLDMIEGEDGRLVDAGDGLAVANWLSTQPPVVPVIIQTTNKNAGDQMEELLSKHGWVLDRVVPYDAENWIREGWRKIVRDLTVSHSPNKSVSNTGIKILKHSLLTDFSSERLFSQILQLASFHVCGMPNSKSLCCELAFHGNQDMLKPIVGVGFSLLSEVFPGATSEIFELSRECFGVGPVASNSESLDDSFRQLLLTANVRQIQLDIVQPKPGLQAMLLIASKSSEIELNSHQVQRNLSEARELLELAMVLKLGELDLKWKDAVPFQAGIMLQDRKEPKQ